MLQIRKVVVGISGGVDSAVATLLLKNKGYNVCAVFMQNWDITDETGICKADEDYSDAAYVCKKLDVPLLRVNFVKEYWNDVFSNLLTEYQIGGTPNPDVLCNQFVKFDAFYKYARANLNADAIATGHYARTSFGPYLEHYDSNKLNKLLTAKDVIKDQTLFLCQVKQEALKRSMFPIGNFSKQEVKAIAVRNGLNRIASKKESMGICFIGLRNFQKFIADYIDDKPGNFIDIDSGKVVGQHNGIHQWTLGQRTKISGAPIAYFTAKKTNTNDIFVAQGTDHPALFSDVIYTSKPHWITSPPPDIIRKGVLECNFKFQHVEGLTECLVRETLDGLIVVLKHANRAITPGQFAVFFKGDECVGSAKIVNSGPSKFSLEWLQKNGCQTVSSLHTVKNNLFQFKEFSDENIYTNDIEAKLINR